MPLFQPPSLSFYILLVREKRKVRVETKKHPAEGQANDTDVEGPPASVDHCDDSRHERGPAGLSSFQGRVDAATCCGQLYHLPISAALHFLFHIHRTRGAHISVCLWKSAAVFCCSSSPSCPKPGIKTPQGFFKTVEDS